MTTVTWLTRATDELMGMQYAETALQQAILAQRPASLDISTVAIAPWAGGRGTHLRIPVKAATHPVAGQLIGAALLRRRHVHRFDLRLPPARDEIVTVHDVAPLLFTDEGSLPAHAGPSVRRARRVITPSEFSAGQIRERLRTDTVVVIPNGVDDLFRHGLRSTPAELEHLGITRPFVLHAGGAGSRKGLEDLAAAWRLLGYDDVQLVMTGPPHPQRSTLFEPLPDVVLTGRVTRGQVAGLMGAAGAVVVPSRYEGFGLPVLEAMASGTPVVCVDTSSLAEVAGGAAELVDPTPEGIAAGLRRVLEATDHAAVLREAGRARAAEFTWERAARAHLDLYEQEWGS